MKNIKSGEKSRWKAEWLKERGEIIESLTTIFNRVKEERQIPLQWRERDQQSHYTKTVAQQKKIMKAKEAFY